MQLRELKMPHMANPLRHTEIVPQRSRGKDTLMKIAAGAIGALVLEFGVKNRSRVIPAQVEIGLQRQATDVQSWIEDKWFAVKKKITDRWMKRQVPQAPPES